ncbi:transposase IS66 [Nitritalea halalkaliphila LW7]|uniref:Transposase IS66 n=2 Tax=Nitritalea TaxID=1187887 RepID=I5BPT1_9BACT|nr:transposase IS66 [Nitritalea halalkaliphila LW7]
MVLRLFKTTFLPYIYVMENREIDYKTLYEQALLTLSQKENSLLEKENLLIEKQELIEKKEQVIFKYRSELDKLLKIIFGPKKDKLKTSVDSDQLNLFTLGVPETDQAKMGGDGEADSDEETVTVKRKKREKGQGRMTLPETLRREDVYIEPTESTEGCVVIGEEVTEVLEMKPAEFYVTRYIRKRYAKPNGEGILMGTLPDRAIEKGIPAASTLAQMTIDKYVYGLPLHRQLDKYSKMGVRIPASTASNWLMQGWKTIEPLWELLKEVVLSQKYLQVERNPNKSAGQGA